MRVIILLSVIGAALAFPKNGNRIVGGTPTTIEEYPFMSNMQYGVFGIFGSACGGSLITTSTVLSAAHCYYGDSPCQWVVRLGSTYTSSGGTVHDVSQLILHENYNPQLLVNDVAIVRLRVAATLSSTIGLARVAGSNYHLHDDTRVYAAGWGRVMDGGPPATQLQHVDLNIINHLLCTLRYAYLKTQPGFENWPDVTPEMLCVGVLGFEGKDSCQGDSGGPVIHNKDIVVGITSWGVHCGDSFYPGVNARVSSYTNWIIQSHN